MLTSAQRNELDNVLRLNKYMPWAPTPKQMWFLSHKDRDVFYGGAAGGAKSVALLMAALQYVDVPGYNALLLRDTYANLNKKGALMQMSHDWMDESDAHWVENRKAWVFPTGAELSFGHLDGPRDHLNFKGPGFHFIGIDEAGDLRWKQVQYMFSRLRREKGSVIPLRFRQASNPGGRSHSELKRRYIDKRTRGKRVFIPARLEDNPYLDREEYIESLNELDPVLRAQLLDGDWDVSEAGRMFDRSWFSIVSEAPVARNYVRYWDLAATEPTSKNRDPDWTVGCKMCSVGGVYYISSIIRFRKTPRQNEQIIRQTAEADGKNVHVHIEQEGGSAGKSLMDHYRRHVLPEFVFKGHTQRWSKSKRAAPFASQAEAGNVVLVAGEWNEEFLDEVEMFPDGNHDDQVDAASGAFTKVVKPTGFRIRTI